MDLHSSYFSDRPYSELEIASIRDLYLEMKKLSALHVYHPKCGHRYRPRRSSAKELFLIMGLPVETNCSVCFMSDHFPAPKPCAEALAHPTTLQQLGEFILFYDWLYKHID